MLGRAAPHRSTGKRQSPANSHARSYVHHTAGSSTRISHRQTECLRHVARTMYEVYVSATDARAIAVQAADDLKFPFERLLAAITPRTKIIAIANPNSPSKGNFR